jgi:glucose-6-phosphate dehydrogenase assembly protein OpcA
MASDLSPGAGLTWRRDPTAPAAVADGLRQLLRRCHAESRECVPARALNLICVVAAGRAGAATERLSTAGRYHASRTIVCAVHPDRTALGATVAITSDTDTRPGEFAVLRETVALDVGERHLPHLDTIVDPLVVTDLPTVAWLPDHADVAIAPLMAIAQATLVDSVEEADIALALRHAEELRRHVHVVDLAWLRSTPWRERVAAAFDPPDVRAELAAITALSVRHEASSRAVALLLAGWLASRLDWRLQPLAAHGDELAGALGGVRVALSPAAGLRVRGLSGLTVETASGRRLSLDRGPGGLAARLRSADGAERGWTVLGASRGEPGVLGEGVRQALLRDPAYAPALRAARALIPERRQEDDPWTR